MSEKNINKNQGFTLIELLIAIAVFTLGIMGAFTLALANINTIRENFNRVLAANISREGVEIVRNMRDSNWLREEANEYCGAYICSWSDGLTAGFYYADYNDAALNPFVCSDLDACISSCTNSGICSLYLNSNVYDHTIGPNKSNMSRIIQIENICIVDASGAPVEDIRTSSCDKSAGEIDAGIRVTSRVRWSGRDKNIDIDSSELIYNWRR
ncbi:prepilin-type N-terminal cleavage/methylation domain-containing protein [Candidatus Parcubacteria bacterium]|nr:MAG: prepilin-type N-terminal cleavage/methylation domain-containing protein [Candidatus Parcubacteria bacterium]